MRPDRPGGSVPGMGWGTLPKRHPGLCAAALLAVGLGLLLVAEGGSGGGERDSRSLSDELLVALSSVTLKPQPVSTPVPPPAEAAPGERKDRNLHEIATVLPGGRVELHSSPGGGVVAVVGDRTEFGSDRNFWIVRHRRGWLGVTTDVLPNSELGWIPEGSPIRVGRSPWWVDADISRRQVRLWRGKRVVRRFAVTVGAPGSPTPPGRYSVTDGLTTRGLEAYYGCCVLALSGHQPNLPAGWIGGDRMAIHGTPGGIGGASSAGCLRASDADMMSLFRRIPLGTPVLIRS
jgi:hypothetical protein